MNAPRRPWWKRKRWIAAGVLWLLVAYPLSVGPVYYCSGRGWLSLGTAYAYSQPALRVFGGGNAPRRSPYFSYLLWCSDLGIEHGGGRTIGY